MLTHPCYPRNFDWFSWGWSKKKYSKWPTQKNWVFQNHQFSILFYQKWKKIIIQRLWFGQSRSLCTESSLASNKNAGTNQRKWNRKPRACNSFPLVFLALKQPQRCHACDDLTDEASWPQWGQILFKSATM